MIIPTEQRELQPNDYANYCSYSENCYRFAYLGTTGQHLIFSKGRSEVRMNLFCSTTLDEVKIFANDNNIYFDFEKWEQENL